MRTDAVLAHSETQAQMLWRLREYFRSAKIDGLSIKHDVSVPISRIAEFIARADALLGKGISRPAHRLLRSYRRRQPALQPLKTCGAGKCIVHAAGATVNRTVHDLVAGLGGSISAEHGLGKLKRDEITRQECYRDGHDARDRCALDPQGLMNPGKVL